VTELGSATYVGIAVDENNVYWTGGFASPVVYQNGKTGTPATQIAIAMGALTCPLHIASDGSNVYFLDQGTDSSGNIKVGAGALYRVPIGNTGALPAPLVSGLTDPQGMAVDGTAVYWVNGTTGVPADAGVAGSVMKLAK
jgi:streptogramin lyase